MGRNSQRATWKVSYFTKTDSNPINRTDNSIKNHFYSTIRRSLRRINKELGDKNSNHSIFGSTFF